MPTKIEWCEETWNPITGCTPTSEGCEHCYAKRMAETRLRGRCGYDEEHPFKVTFHKSRMDQPFRWKNPRKIFVCSMGDLFHDDVFNLSNSSTVDYAFGSFTKRTDWPMLDAVLTIMERAKQHTFLILTKRPENMLKYFSAVQKSNQEYADSFHKCPTEAMRNSPCARIAKLKAKNPIPSNVFLGVSVENQQRADERIPILLNIPAKVRFVSVEPMLGSVDLSKWIYPITIMPLEKAPKTWKDWNTQNLWPNWVPEKWRRKIEEFWSDSVRRGPRDWLKDTIHQNCPPHGMTMIEQDPINKKGPIKGRFLHTWNNMCILVEEDGMTHVTSTPRTGLLDHGPQSGSYQLLNWVICGGETGPGSRPMHPDWVLNLRDQCQVANVPFFFKSWGDWVHKSQVEVGLWVGPHYHHHRLDLFDFDLMVREKFFDPKPGLVWKVGKKRAGRLLDGREWNEFPGDE